MNENEKTFSVEEGLGKEFWFSVDAILSDEEVCGRKKRSANVFVPSLRGVDYSHGKQKSDGRFLQRI
jgi:hypothetical protein